MDLDRNLILKNLILNYFYIVIVTLFSFTILYWYEDIFPFNYFSLFGFICHILVLFILFKIENFKLINNITQVYLVFLTLFLYPHVLIFWNVGRITAFIWYLIIPFGITLIFPFRIVVYWSIYISILIFSIIIISAFFPFEYFFSDTQLTSINIMTLFFCLCFIILILYYFNKIQQCNYEEKFKKEDGVSFEEYSKPEIEKCCKIYDSIVKYFESTKPYKSPDYNISQLANDLGTNITYISRALNYNKNMNYNLFVNTYRINEVKEMIEQNYHNKYTLKFIYTSAGFKHQSTFNKVFKQIEGVTPSEYIKNNYTTFND